MWYSERVKLKVVSRVMCSTLSFVASRTRRTRDERSCTCGETGTWRRQAHVLPISVSVKIE